MDKELLESITEATDDISGFVFDLALGIRFDSENETESSVVSAVVYFFV